MELTTFGAILRFAIEMEAQGADFYQSAAARVSDEALKDVFAQVARARKKRKQLLKRTRQENVVEMILERISGLDGDSYLACVGAADDPLATAIEYESKAERYYLDAGNKLSIVEVTRVFERLARENAQQIGRLRQIQRFQSNHWKGDQLVLGEYYQYSRVR